MGVVSVWGWDSFGSPETGRWGWLLSFPALTLHLASVPGSHSKWEGFLRPSLNRVALGIHRESCQFFFPKETVGVTTMSFVSWVSDGPSFVSNLLIVRTDLFSLSLTFSGTQEILVGSRS